MFNLDTGGPGFPYYNSLIRDGSSNLYGVTSEGGANNTGAAFKLTHTSSGGFVKSIIYSFPKLANNELIGALVMDPAGNLYGVSATGGSQDTGYAYELSPNADGTWTETVLHNFGPCCVASDDGAEPFAGLAIDAQGNLFGTTSGGGLNTFGTVYKLARNADGTWTETILYAFPAYYTLGGYPESGLLIDGRGNLYGTASQGGLFVGTCTVGCGSVYKLTPGPNGYTFSALHKFHSSDGQYPRYAGVSMDRNGNLFGTTEGGGPSGGGTVWELVYSQGLNAYTEQVVYGFGAQSGDGSGPFSGVTLDPAGNIFGATPSSGLHGFGNVYKLARNANNTWQEAILYQFQEGRDGAYPSGGVVLLGNAENVLGMTSGGGLFGPGS